MSDLIPIAWLMDDLVCPHRDFTSSRAVAERRSRKPKAWRVTPLVLAEDAKMAINDLKSEIERLRSELASAEKAAGASR